MKKLLLSFLLAACVFGMVVPSQAQYISETTYSAISGTNFAVVTTNSTGTNSKIYLYGIECLGMNTTISAITVWNAPTYAYATTTLPLAGGMNAAEILCTITHSLGTTWITGPEKNARATIAATERPGGAYLGDVGANLDYSLASKGLLLSKGIFVSVAPLGAGPRVTLRFKYIRE